jgi:hypothetical protein
MSFRTICAGAALVVGSLLQGCFGNSGSASPREPVYKVSGRITLTGAPLADANVTFSPKDKQALALGRTDKDGKYKLTTYDYEDGAAAGGYVVLVSLPHAIAPSSTAKPPAHGVNAPAVDGAAAHAASSAQSAAAGPIGKYGQLGTSDLTAEVKPGGPQELNFDLKP